VLLRAKTKNRIRVPTYTLHITKDLNAADDDNIISECIVC
jgi:hypothetical protein